MSKQVKVLAEGQNGTEWLDGEIVGEWKRSTGFRTDRNPEPGGPVVNVPGCIYREKTFNATWEQVDA
jgi:hypothetical protein